MDQKDVPTWVHGPGDDEVIEFTDYGIKTLTGPVEIFKVEPHMLKRPPGPS